ncbi:MAG: type II toxin-antitoxin system VapC family toxin [Acidobacteriota bacterium]
MIVVDASAVLEILKQTENGFRLESLLADDELHAPHLIDLEVATILRRWVIHGEMSLMQAGQALEQFLQMPLQRHAHTNLLLEVWKLRHNLTAYDASYLTLAHFLGAELVTMDDGLRKMAARGRPR